MLSDDSDLLSGEGIGFTTIHAELTNCPQSLQIMVFSCTARGENNNIGNDSSPFDPTTRLTVLSAAPPSVVCLPAIIS